jgi:nucleotide-binding universal stress UspA family protein
MDALVTLATYEQAKTAYFLKEKLESENIDCYFAIVTGIESKWDKVRVQVREDDVENAIKIMLRIKDEHGMDIEKIKPARHVRKIIVPTDFSEGSENACYYAIRLAQKINAEIKLLHVYENPTADVNIKKSATYEDYVAQTLRETEKKAKASIVAFTQKMKDYIAFHKIAGVKIHSSMVMGNIIEKIKGISKIYKPEMIVLGTIGRKEGSKSVLTGVTNEIINALEIPVYAIPGPTSDKDFEKVNILYATDFNEKDHKSLDQLLKIVDPLDKRIACIHIDTAHNPAKKERMDELNKFLKKDYSQHDIYCQLIEDVNVYHGLKEFADKNSINLLSFTVQKRGIFEKLFKPNLFKKILQEANLPILIFPS